MKPISLSKATQNQIVIRKVSPAFTTRQSLIDKLFVVISKHLAFSLELALDLC